MLTNLINTHIAATAKYRAADESDSNYEKLWEEKEDAELAVMRCPCASFDDVRAKARWALSDEVVQDSLMNCQIDHDHVLEIFLRSMLGGEPVEKSNNGEN